MGSAPKPASGASGSRLLQDDGGVDLAAPPADAPSLADDLAEMDDHMKQIVEERRKEKEKERAARLKSMGGSKKDKDEDVKPKKPVSEMTSEEKMAWLEEKREIVKARRAREAIEVYLLMLLIVIGAGVGVIHLLLFFFVPSCFFPHVLFS